MTKQAYFLALTLLSSACAFVTKTQASSNDYEETFDSSKIKGLKFEVDRSDITIKATGEKLSRVRVSKVSNCGEVKLSLTDGELKIQSTRPPRGGCHVNYEAFIPAGTPVNIKTGRSSVDIDNMGELKIKAGMLDLKSKNTVPVNLQYASGRAEIYHDKLPDHPYSNAISTADGSATFHLPAQSTVNIMSSGWKAYESDFTNSAKALFPIVFSSAQGKLNVKKN